MNIEKITSRITIRPTDRKIKKTKQAIAEVNAQAMESDVYTKTATSKVQQNSISKFFKSLSKKLGNK